MKWKLLIIFVISMVTALFFPVKYYFTDKTITAETSFISYEEAIIDSLPKIIKIKAEEYGCKNFILPVKDIKDVPASIHTITEDINLALSSYRRWTVQVTEEQKNEMIKRQEEKIRKWGALLSGEDIQQILTTQQQVNMSIDYSAEVVLSRIQPVNGNDLQLTLTINHEMTMSKLFDIRVTFADPATIEENKRKSDEMINSLNTLKSRCRQGVFAVLIIVVIFFLVLVTITIYTYIQKKKREQLLTELANQIEKRSNLIDNGHYVAALDLAEKYLQYFPNDVEICAFKERLLDFTSNDPKKAQIAYVEAKKIQARLQKPMNGNFLTSEEKNSINALIPYNQELADSYTQLIGYEAETRQKQEFNEKQKQLRDMINEKKINQADRFLKEIEKQYSLFPEVNNLRIELNDFKEVSVRKLQMIPQEVLSNGIETAKILLKELIDNYKDYQEAHDLLAILENKKLKNGFRLVSSEDSKEIIILNKREYILGREEHDINIDIILNDKHISRPHLKIVIENDKIIIEDLNSAGGTYINGEKINKYILRNNEMLTLAKVIDLDYSIYKGEKNNIGGMLINLPERSYLLITDKVLFSIKKSLMLSDGKYSMCFKDGIPIFIAENDLQIISVNNKLTICTSHYSVKEL